MTYKEEDKLLNSDDPDKIFRLSCRDDGCYQPLPCKFALCKTRK